MLIKTLIKLFSNLTRFLILNDKIRLSSEIINEAIEKYKQKSSDLPENQQGVLFKLLQKDKKYAIVMAFDMIFGGVDTVCDYSAA
jgi:predicted restriction endonuclease